LLGNLLSIPQLLILFQALSSSFAHCGAYFQRGGGRFFSDPAGHLRWEWLKKPWCS
jgi:hypothetical protein